MITSGIAITLSSLPGERDCALVALRRLGWLELGPAHGPRLAAVLEAPSPAVARERFESLRLVPGVDLVDLVVALLDEPPPPACPGPQSANVQPRSVAADAPATEQENP